MEEITGGVAPMSGPPTSLAAGGRGLVAGAGIWILYCVFTLVGSLFLSASRGVNLTPGGFVVVGIAGFGAILTALLGSFLMTVAAWHLRQDLLRFLETPLPTEQLRASVSATARRSLYAGTSFLVYGLLGAVALLALGYVTSLMDDPARLFQAAAALGLLDLGASFALLYASGLLSDALHSLRLDFAWLLRDPRVSPPNLRGFAYMNLAGTVVAAVSLLLLVGSPTDPSSSLCLLLVGGVLAGVVAPLYGFAGFYGIIRFGGTLL